MYLCQLLRGSHCVRQKVRDRVHGGCGAGVGQCLSVERFEACLPVERSLKLYVSLCPSEGKRQSTWRVWGASSFLRGSHCVRQKVRDRVVERFEAWKVWGRVGQCLPVERFEAWLYVPLLRGSHCVRQKVRDRVHGGCGAGAMPFSLKV